MAAKSSEAARSTGSRRRRNRVDIAWPASRRLIVVDIENVVGGTCDTEARAEWAYRRLLDTIDFREEDQVVVGVDVGALAFVAWVWARARSVPGYGADGADIALLEVLREDVARRFNAIVVASGDGIFADLVTELTGHGVHVTVAAHECALSAKLRLAASEVVLLSRLEGVPSQRSA